MQKKASQHAESANVARRMLNEAVQHEAGLGLQMKTAEQQKRSADKQLADWKARLGQTERRLAEMEERKQSALVEKIQLESQPEKIKNKQQELMDRLEAAETERLTRSDSLRKVEMRLGRQWRPRGGKTSQKREALIRADASCERYKLDKDNLIQRIKDKLDCTQNVAELAKSVRTAF